MLSQIKDIRWIGRLMWSLRRVEPVIADLRKPGSACQSVVEQVNDYREA